MRSSTPCARSASNRSKCPRRRKRSGGRSIRLKRPREYTQHGGTEGTENTEKPRAGRVTIVIVTVIANATIATTRSYTAFAFLRVLCVLKGYSDVLCT